MRFSVEFNGSKLCTAGIDGYGVVSVVVHSAWRNPDKIPESVAHDPLAEKEAELEVGGLNSDTEEQLEWVKQPINAGDEIVVKVLPSGDSDQAAVKGRRRKTVEKELKGTTILLRAVNRDDRRRGWAVVVPEYCEKSITTILMEPIDLQDLALRESVVGDITIYYTSAEDGNTDNEYAVLHRVSL